MIISVVEKSGSKNMERKSVSELPDAMDGRNASPDIPIKKKLARSWIPTASRSGIKLKKKQPIFFMVKTPIFLRYKLPFTHATYKAFV